MNKDQLRKLDDAKRKGVRANAERLAEEGNDAQKAAARQALADLDELETEDRQALAESVSGMDQAQRVTEAFRAVPLTATETRLVEVLMANPGANSPQLSTALGWAEGGGWHLHFGKMCNARGEYLWPAPFAEKRDADFYCGILCDTSWDSGTLTYVLKPEVEAAFAAMGLRARIAAP